MHFHWRPQVCWRRWYGWPSSAYIGMFGVETRKKNQVRVYIDSQAAAAAVRLQVTGSRLVLLVVPVLLDTICANPEWFLWTKSITCPWRQATGKVQQL